MSIITPPRLIDVNFYFSNKKCDLLLILVYGISTRYALKSRKTRFYFRVFIRINR